MQFFFKPNPPVGLDFLEEVGRRCRQRCFGLCVQCDLRRSDLGTTHQDQPSALGYHWVSEVFSSIPRNSFPVNVKSSEMM